MKRAMDALSFVGTVLVEGTSGGLYAVTATALTERTRLSLGQKVFAKTAVGFVGGSLMALAGVPRIGAGVANASLTQLGEGIATKMKLNQVVDRMLSGNANSANASTPPSGALGPGAGARANAGSRPRVRL